MIPKDCWPYDEKPLLVFWETTKACLLACKHCRAKAIKSPLPGELSTEEGFALIDMVASFGQPYPVLVLTGGDPLMRSDFWDLVMYAKSRRLRVGVAPSVTPLLTEKVVSRMAEIGVDAVSVSLDSGVPEVHDAIRGVKGNWEATIRVIKLLLDYGLRVQVNTLLCRDTVEYLPETLKAVLDLGITVVEVFYVVPVGRAGMGMMLHPWEFEDATHFLVEATRYGLTVRATEGPFYRRVAIARSALRRAGIDPDERLEAGALYRRLIEKALRILGRPEHDEYRCSVRGTRDGKGIIFVAYNGVVQPSGFTPYSLGSVRERSLAEIYRDHPVLKKIRRAEFRGRCGRCEFRDVCGGSRARAYAVHGDVLAEDPACPYQPGSLEPLLRELGVELK